MVDETETSYLNFHLIISQSTISQSTISFQYLAFVFGVITFLFNFIPSVGPVMGEMMVDHEMVGEMVDGEMVDEMRWLMMRWWMVRW